MGRGLEVFQRWPALATPMGAIPRMKENIWSSLTPYSAIAKKLSKTYKTKFFVVLDPYPETEYTAEQHIEIRTHLPDRTISVWCGVYNKVLLPLEDLFLTPREWEFFMTDPDLSNYSLRFYQPS